jgi:hypothetical protein
MFHNNSIKDSFFYHAMLLHHYRSLKSQFSYRHPGILGLNSLYHFNPTCSFGYELYIIPKESSGGLSFGCRYKDWTWIMNPIMGYLSTSFTRSLFQDCDASTRFEFNVLSRESDLSAGFRYSPSGTGKSIQMRGGFRQWAIKFQHEAESIQFGFGLCLDTSGPKPMTSVEFEFQF